MAVADCTGHGVPGAMAAGSGSFSSLARNTSARVMAPPVEVPNRLLAADTMPLKPVLPLTKPSASACCGFSPQTLRHRPLIWVSLLCTAILLRTPGSRDAATYRMYYGTPSALIGWGAIQHNHNWANASAAVTDPAGNSVRFVIHRLCALAGDPASATANCMRASGTSTGGGSIHEDMRLKISPDRMDDRWQLLNRLDGLKRELETAAALPLDKKEKTPLAHTIRSCQQILKLEPALWTFVEQIGLEPTNNAAEQALRPAVQLEGCPRVSGNGQARGHAPLPQMNRGQAAVSPISRDFKRRTAVSRQ